MRAGTSRRAPAPRGPKQGAPICDVARDNARRLSWHRPNTAGVMECDRRSAPTLVTRSPTAVVDTNPPAALRRTYLGRSRRLKRGVGMLSCAVARLGWRGETKVGNGQLFTVAGALRSDAARIVSAVVAGSSRKGLSVSGDPPAGSWRRIDGFFVVGRAGWCREAETWTSCGAGARPSWLR
jgi:hypothetical protein